MSHLGCKATIMSNDFNHGIVYSPSTIIAAKPLDVEDLVSLNICEFLVVDGTRFD